MVFAYSLLSNFRYVEGDQFVGHKDSQTLMMKMVLMIVMLGCANKPI